MASHRAVLSASARLLSLVVGVGVLTQPLTSVAGVDDDESTVAARQQQFLVTVNRSDEIRSDGDVNAVSSGASEAQITAARQSYVDSSLCLPSSIAGLTLGNVCVGRTACDETTFGRYLQAPYLATGLGRPSNCTPTPGQDPAAVVNAAVYEAFRAVPLPETTLQIQPPDATTLVNLPTNFFTTTESFTTTVTVLGYTVDLDITPTSYTWDFGDGTTRTTTTPGAPYPDLDITHTYTYPTNLTTTWSADYRVDDGPWQRVQGTVDMPSPTIDLQVREATPVLTG